MTSKTVTMKTVDYDRMIAGENALREEFVKREREFAQATAEQGEWLAKAHAEIDRLRARNKTLEERLDQILILANLE